MRLSDEQVAIQADPDRRDPLALLAREVQESRAARLRCPTCHDLVLDNPCPDCIDGFLSYADSMKLLLATTRKLRDCLHLTGLWARVADADAVLALTEEPT